jgi:transcriptional regulator with XRE-family HTH domain
MKLSKKLKALRLLNNDTQKEFAIMVNITGRSYQGLEYGKHIPGGKVLQKLCNKFPQYALWLMTDIDDVASIKNQAIMEISKKLKALRQLNDCTQKEFAITVNIAWQSYQRLEYGKHIPGGRVLQKLCNKFPQYALWLMTNDIDVRAVENKTLQEKSIN